MSHAEATAAAALSDLHVQRTTQLMAWEQQERLLREQLELATEDAVKGPRRLLTAADTELQQAVMHAFEVLGFDVTDMDEAKENGAPKQEDLQVTFDSKTPAIIVEVKGTTGDAKTAWIGQIGRHAQYFVSANGLAPAGQWLVTNTYRTSPPGDRRRPYNNNNSEDLDGFVEGSGGLVIPTTNLFRLMRDVEESVLTAEEARHLLLSLTGRLEYPD